MEILAAIFTVTTVLSAFVGLNSLALVVYDLFTGYRPFGRFEAGIPESLEVVGLSMLGVYIGLSGLSHLGIL